MLVERRRLSIDVDEDEVEPAAHAHRLQRQTVSREGRILVETVAAELGRGDEAAREIIGPGMPRAGEARASFGGLCHDAHRPVAADVEEAADLSVLAAQQ